MTFTNGSISVSSTSTQTDLGSEYDSAVIENKGISTAYVKISRSTGSATTSDFPVPAGRILHVSLKLRYILSITSGSDTTTLQYVAVGRE